MAQERVQLTQEDKEEIYRRHVFGGETQRSLAKDFGVSTTTITAVIREMRIATQGIREADREYNAFFSTRSTEEIEELRTSHAREISELTSTIDVLEKYSSDVQKQNVQDRALLKRITDGRIIDSELPSYIKLKEKLEAKILAQDNLLAAYWDILSELKEELRLLGEEYTVMGNELSRRHKNAF